GPVSRTFPTPWKKTGGKWYFVVDTSAVQFALSQGKGAPPDVRPALTTRSSIVFGQDSEIQKSLRLENHSAGAVHFRVAGWDNDWFDINNSRGEIPAGESFPLVVVLKQIPAQRQRFVIAVEAVEPDKRVTRLEIPVEVEVPGAAFRKEMERAVRIYRAEQ
ncbi:MAG: mobile sperm domain-containing protein, partial [Acidobacteria bacterium]|nr:mobile sperm domain-containing protein [Acidobacteriota bacterium]